MAIRMKQAVDRNSSTCMTGPLSDLCELLLAVLASFTEHLSTGTDELSVFSEIAECAPAAERVEAVRVSRSAGAHLVITLSRAFE